ncbi:WXG100 family type VII secretion target [Nonomuraea sp. NPDC050556]|uniref:WXG100 family type VII secretion target n=1 Tax=Nonomuraea sp. NPDC050556 TaxID=3364369 RepID=UPI0037BBC884
MKDSEKLRTAATRLRTLAGELDDKPADLRRAYPYQKFWKGPAADDFNKALEGGIKDLGSLATDLENYAKRLEEKATKLDEEEKKPK